MMPRVTPVLIAASVLLAAGSARAVSDIRNTRHNLSVSGPGSVKALTEDQVCIFCHTPHNASPQTQLWNRDASTAAYRPYSSSSMNALPGQPTGASKLCLSCHDGTIALGDVLSEPLPITMAGGITVMPPGATNLGTNLRDDHPISFSYTPGLAVADGELNDPGTLTGDVRLDSNGEVQCTSCHDAHDDTYGFFLVADNIAAGTCRACHVPNDWPTSSHKTSAATWSGQLPNPWPHTPYTTVTANACESCHNPHTAQGTQRLLNASAEEQNCYPCHNGHVASTDIEADFNKPYSHPIASASGVHDPEEPGLVTLRHVECVDCHNAHAADASTASAPSVPGVMKSLKGIDGGGNAVFPAANQYEICFRCHADSPGKGSPHTPRQVVQGNLRLDLAPTAYSFHPVESAGVNPNVPSLLPPYTTSSFIYCTDCHSSNSGAKAGGTGPDGPHGSTYPVIMGWRYETADNTPESPAAYALCYRCHDRTSIINDRSFKEHDKHIRGESTPCNVCHAPHGVSSAQGSAVNHSHLINFNTAVVSPNSSNGRLEFVDTGTFSGTCTLRCHGVNHNALSY